MSSEDSEDNEKGKNTLGQLRICVQKTLKSHKPHLEHIEKTAHSEMHHKKLSAAFWASKIWPKGHTIKIGFLGEADKIKRTAVGATKQGQQPDPLQDKVKDMSVKDAIKLIVKERLQPLVNLKLEFVDDPKTATVRVKFDPDDGAWSYVGTDCDSKEHPKDKPTMNLGWFDVATTIHEFCHVLGMIHEHQNPRGKPIPWNVPKVLAWAKSNQGWDANTTKDNIIDKYAKTQINGSNFDPCSIMLYFFPAELTLDNKGTHQNIRISGADVKWINHIYARDTSEQKQLNYVSKMFENFYNEDLTKNIKNCVTKQAPSIFSLEYKNFWINIAILLGVIIGSILLWKLISKNRASRRYGR